MRGPKATPPDGRTERQKLMHDLAERVTVIQTNVRFLRNKYRGKEDQEIFQDLEEAADRAVKLFEELRDA